jgi:hypothetical protein
MISEENINEKWKNKQSRTNLHGDRADHTALHKEGNPR